jgi:hypothetical protein
VKVLVVSARKGRGRRFFADVRVFADVVIVFFVVVVEVGADFRNASLLRIALHHADRLDLFDGVAR